MSYIDKHWDRAVNLDLNLFVFIVQAFQKVSALKTLAPTQPEAPFLVAQLVVQRFSSGLRSSRQKHFRREQVSAT